MTNTSSFVRCFPTPRVARGLSASASTPPPAVWATDGGTSNRERGTAPLPFPPPHSIDDLRCRLVTVPQSTQAAGAARDDSAGCVNPLLGQPNGGIAHGTQIIVEVRLGQPGPTQVLRGDFGRAGADRRPQGEQNHNQIVELTGDRDDPRHEVDWRDGIGAADRQSG